MITKNTVKPYARRFEFLCMGLMLLTLVIPVMLWFFGDKIVDSTYGIPLKNFSYTQRFMFLLSDYIASALMIYALYLCIKIARIFQQGKTFTHETRALFVQLRTAMAWIGIYNVLWYISFDMLFSSRPISLILFFTSISAVHYMFIFSFLSIFATLVYQASELQSDQDLTI